MKFKWLGQSTSVRRFVIGYFVLLVFLIFIEFFVHKHAELFLEGLVFFFPVYGFISCILVFSAAKIMSKIIKRDPDYYEQ